MDKRKLKFTSGLHRGLNRATSGSSQTSISSSQSSISSQNDFAGDESILRKRKLSAFSGVTDISQNEAKKKCTKLPLEQQTNKSFNSGALSAEHSKLVQTTQLSNALMVDKNELEKTRIVRDNSTKWIQTKEKTVLHDFVEKCGITIGLDGTIVFHKDIAIIKMRMKNMLKSNEYYKEDIIKSIEEYIQTDGNIEHMLTDMNASFDCQKFDYLNNTNLVRLLLQMSELQPDIHICFLNKLNESVLLVDSMEKLAWAGVLLQQFRFLEIVIDPDSLTKTLEQLIEMGPTWFQRDLILHIPDIIADSQHQVIADVLYRQLEHNPELTSTVLECITNLTLDTSYLNDYRDKVLDMLSKNVKTDTIPAIVKFILNDCTSLKMYKRILSALRTVDMQPLLGESLDDCYKNQVLTMKYIKISILYSKDMVNGALSVIKDVAKDPRPMDIVLLLLISSSDPGRKRNVDAVLKHHVRSGFYRFSLLQQLYDNYKEVIRNLQSSVVQLASSLLKTEERAYIDFAMEWFRLQFLSHKETVHKQRKIIEKLILLIGNDNKTARNALMTLCKIAERKEDKLYLYAHCNHLKILLEKMDNFDLEEVGILSDLLHSLCAHSLSESLRDDLFILLQKQLSAMKPLTKCKGVLGAVMAIKHLVYNVETCDAAYNLLKKVLTAVKVCPWSQALFYDQLTQVIAQAECIHEEFLHYITTYFYDEFVNEHMIEQSNYKGDLTVMFGLSNAEDTSYNLILNFENKRYGAIVAITFKLLKTCYMKSRKNEDLDNINCLLGCAILMPQTFDVVEPSMVDLTIHCINWLREIINGFVTQTRSSRNQVLKRLSNLMYLQGELSIMLPMCDPKHQPTPCYFHHFPPPPFIRTDKTVIKKKTGKKSVKKSTNSYEQESWEIGSAICSKNPIYFRKLDAKIIDLFDCPTNLQLSQASLQSISISQVCFIVKELLGIFENEINEGFVRDIICLLPKICKKLHELVSELREVDASQNRQAVRLILCLLTMLFNWKGFQSATYNLLLREGLRVLASQQNQLNSSLRSCKELVTESCKYVESLSDVATQISLAVVLVDLHLSLMKHSESYMQENKESNAKMALKFLSHDWQSDRHFGAMYRTAVNALVKSWIDHELSPLNTITVLLKWLPNEVAKLEKPQDCLDRLPSINRDTFQFLYKKILEGMIKGVKISLSSARRDSERIEVWLHVAENVEKTVEICKILKTKANILLFLRFMPALLRIFLNVGIPTLEYNLKYYAENVTRSVKLMQVGTKYLHAICCDVTQKKDTILTKHIPAAKSVLERLVYSVKGMLVLNNSSTAFWMGNLLNKNLEGQDILSQTSSSEETTIPDTNTLTNLTSEVTSDVSSEILDSDSSDELVEKQEV